MTVTDVNFLDYNIEVHYESDEPDEIYGTEIEIKHAYIDKTVYVYKGRNSVTARVDILDLLYQVGKVDELEELIVKNY